MSLEAALLAASGEVKGKVELPEFIFQGDGSLRVLQETLVAYRRNLRRGTSETKTRGEVRGGGHKPWKQKGTGNARAGTIRSPLWRKGGIIFGPHPRSYRVDLDHRKRLIAFKTALADKAKAADIRVVDSLPGAGGKTRQAAQFLEKAELAGRVLLVVDRKTESPTRAFRNISRVQLADVHEIHAASLLAAHRLIFTQAALQALGQRIHQG